MHKVSYPIGREISSPILYSERMRFFLVWGALVLLALPGVALRLEPLSEAVQHPASRLSLDQEGLVDLSLALSGVPVSSRPAYAAVLKRWSSEYQATDPGWPPEKKAEALLEFLHRKLKSYSTYQTRLDVLIDRGTFNCVSSAVAYMILGREVGLDIQAVATSDHAFALVRLPGGREVDVETTTKYGFDPGVKNEFTDSFGQTGFAYVPPGNYRLRRTIGDRQLLGLLVQNRMADFRRSGQVEEAVGLAIDRWTFEGTPEAFQTLVDGFLNYGSWLNGRRDYLKGLELVEKMVLWTGLVPEVKELAWALLNNHVNQLLDKQDFAGAQALIVTYRNRGLLSEVQGTQTLAVVADRRLATAVKTLPYTEAAAQVDQAFSQGVITAVRRQELLSYLYSQEVQKLATGRGPQAAWTFLDGLPAEIRDLPALTKTREVYIYNWSVEIHNRFAQMWNVGKKTEARQLLEDSLLVLPDNAMLKKDLVLSQGR